MFEFPDVSLCFKFPDLLQFAYQEKLSALHASFTLQEVINYNIERSSKVYTCLLDSSKAFDVVWIDGLFYKLYKFGICGNMWRLLYAAYTDMKSSVMFNGIYSRWFCVKQSVRQGGVLSPWLYLLYLNDMLVELRSVPEALRIGNLKLNYVAQADDVAILSLTPKGLQHLLDIVYAYSRKWRLNTMSLKPKLWFLEKVRDVSEIRTTDVYGSWGHVQYHRWTHINTLG